MLADLHIHSDNSPDGENSVIELCESAVAKKLTYIAITDHCEIDNFFKDDYNKVVRQSYFDILKAQDVFKGQVKVLRGLELGNALYNPSVAQQVVSGREYDIILGSLHHPAGIEDFAFLDYHTLDPYKLLNRYFDELGDLADWGRFDVLAHLTYPLRYINGEQKMGVDIHKFQDKIKIVLKKIIAKGRGLEINTSGLRQAYGLTLPGLWCLKLYRELGGEIITTGSDSHRMEDVGANIRDGLLIAKKAGFDYYCVYREHKPVFIRIQA